MIIARERETAQLGRYLNSQKAEFIALYGRRRVGKTFLINEYFRGKGIFFEVTGSRFAPREEQLMNYHREYVALFGEYETEAPPADWSEAFHRLHQAIEKIDSKHKIIIFIDELPWLAKPRSGFLSALEYSWNRHLSRNKNVLLIICGSAAAWMIKNIINNKGGLYDRLSADMLLQPFNLCVVEKFFQHNDISLPHKQIVELFMVMGGVGKYLSYVEPGRSPAQIINDLCFTPAAPLFLEFTKLYSSLFDDYEKHVAVVRALAKKRRGLTQEMLLAAVKFPKGGNFSLLLNELELCGFIMRVPMFGKQVKEHQYRLSDEYSLFYLAWIESMRSGILQNFDQDYWIKLQASQSWKTWAGYAFENICFKHVAQIKKALGLAAVQTTESYWSDAEAEADMVIERADNCINLVEIKFYNREFVMNKRYAEILENKRQIFLQKTKTKKAVFITLITPYGAKENQYYHQVVQNQLTLEDLFTEI